MNRPRRITSNIDVVFAPAHVGAGKMTCAAAAAALGRPSHGSEHTDCPGTVLLMMEIDRSDLRGNPIAGLAMLFSEGPYRVGFLLDRETALSYGRGIVAAALEQGATPETDD